MSILRCKGCDMFIDTDDDPGCFGEDGDLPPFCEKCREEVKALAPFVKEEA